MSNTANTPHRDREPTENIAVRLPAHIVERIDAKRAEMCKASPGVAITRSDAVRVLLIFALDAERSG